jgi:hypothetical protein
MSAYCLSSYCILAIVALLRSQLHANITSKSPASCHRTILTRFSVRFLRASHSFSKFKIRRLLCATRLAFPRLATGQ